MTGEPVDMLIMDDIYKDAKSAWSPVVREAIEDWYDTVAETRLHNDSQQLIVFTRWHEHDLAGRLLEQQGRYSEDNPDGWVVVVYQAIKVGAPSEYDPREEGEALWPERHNLAKLQSTRKRNPHVFESLYQQDPKPVEGLMYENPFNEYEVIPYCKRMIRKNYTDTADEGKDFLCSICYVETEAGNYVLDVLYTQKGMEYTEPKTAEMLSKHNIQEAVIESAGVASPVMLAHNVGSWGTTRPRSSGFIKRTTRLSAFTNIRQPFKTCSISRRGGNTCGRNSTRL